MAAESRLEGLRALIPALEYPTCCDVVHTSAPTLLTQGATSLSWRTEPAWWPNSQGFCRCLAVAAAVCELDFDALHAMRVLQAPGVDVQRFAVAAHGRGWLQGALRRAYCRCILQACTTRH
jgi:hypothetical protein